MIAAIYDIHGNLPALEAVIRELRGLAVDQVVVGGDVFPGPMPRETLECLLDLPWPVHYFYGNGEVAMLQPDSAPAAYRPIMQWNAEQLTVEQRDFVSAWPKTITLDVPGLGVVLFCHATARNENETFTRGTPDERVGPMFADANADMVVCGHTHMQFERHVGRLRVLNAGSVGMPFGDPGAYWLLLGPDVQFRKTPYYLAEAAARIRRTGYPQADEFAANSVLSPPSEEKMLALLNR